MPQTGNLYEPMGPLPIPQAVATPPPQPQQDVRSEQQGPAQMPSNYYGGKAGAAAYVADNVLRGWLAGTKMANERKQKAMSDEIGSAKTGVDLIGQSYRAAVESGDPKRIEETKKALSEAWNDYLNKAQQYSMPEEGGKKSTGQKIKSGLKRALTGGEPPHLNIAQSTFDILRKTDPTAMYGPSKTEQLQQRAAEAQVSGAEQQQKWAKEDHDRKQAYSDLLSEAPGGDPNKLPADKQQQFHQLESWLYPTDPLTRQKMLALDQIKNLNGQKPDDNTQRYWESLGVWRRDQPTSNIGIAVDPRTKKPRNQLTMVYPDGTVTQKFLEGTPYIPPDQADLAGKLINTQVGTLSKWYGKVSGLDMSKPENQRSAYEFALNAIGIPLMGGPQKSQMEMSMMDRAIGEVFKAHTREYKDPSTGAPTTSHDELYNAMLGNVVTMTEDGKFVYMPQLAPGENISHWFKPDEVKWGGLTQDQLGRQEQFFREEVRRQLKKDNPKMTDWEIDRIMGKPIAKAPAQGMTSPPGAGMTAPPIGSKTYVMKDPAGRTIATDVTEAEKQQMEKDPQSAGATFTPNP